MLQVGAIAGLHLAAIPGMVAARGTPIIPWTAGLVQCVPLPSVDDHLDAVGQLDCGRHPAYDQILLPGLEAAALRLQEPGAV
jgi:hypothetical protein